MKISGLQKLTLLDFPGKMACTVFLQGCNFRCPFCQNGQLVLPEKYTYGGISEDDFFSFLKKRASVLDGVCISGGEPMIHAELESFIVRIKAMGYAVKLDTNGSCPEKLKQFISAGLLDYVAMDIKNSPERYAETVGLPGMDLTGIYKSVDLLKSGAIPYEFRTTVIKEFHEKRNFCDIAAWIKGPGKYFIQNFVDSEDVIQKGLHGFEADELQEILTYLRKFGLESDIRGTL